MAYKVAILEYASPVWCLHSTKYVSKLEIIQRVMSLQTYSIHSWVYIFNPAGCAIVDGALAAILGLNLRTLVYRTLHHC